MRKTFHLFIHYVSNTIEYCTVVTAVISYAASLAESIGKVKWPHEDVLMFDLNVLYRRKHTQTNYNIQFL